MFGDFDGNVSAAIIQGAITGIVGAVLVIGFIVVTLIWIGSLA